MNELLALLSTSFIAISAVCVAVGWVKIARRETKAHEKWMVATAVFATLFFLFYLTRTALVGNTVFGEPDVLKSFYRTFLFFHIVLATIGGVMGLVTLRLAYKKQFVKHRKIGPVTSIVWFCAAVTGVTVYVLLYVLYPGGETRPLLEAIFG